MLKPNPNLNIELNRSKKNIITSPSNAGLYKNNIEETKAKFNLLKYRH